MGPALIVSGTEAIANLLPYPKKASVPTPVSSVCKFQVLKTSEHLYFFSHLLERLSGIKVVYRAVTPYNHSLPHLSPLCPLRGKALELPAAMDSIPGLSTLVLKQEKGMFLLPWGASLGTWQDHKLK